MDRKSSDALGVTFTGSVTFNGPMFDIHDNEHVYIGTPAQMAQQTAQMPEEPEATAPAARVPSEAEQPAVLPPPLGSDEAARYWQRLLRDRFVDASCRLLPTTTRQQAMYIAEAFAAKLGVKAKWKLFEQLWGINNLAQEKYAFVETGKMPPRAKEIDAIFED